MTRRTCPTCDRPVYYGIYCDNHCADIGYRKWVKSSDAREMKAKEALRASNRQAKQDAATTEDT